MPADESDLIIDADKLGVSRGGKAARAIAVEEPVILALSPLQSGCRLVITAVEDRAIP
jgi:hypothetical protein